jgi:hypothetical protein
MVQRIIFLFYIVQRINVDRLLHALTKFGNRFCTILKEEGDLWGGSETSYGFGRVVLYGYVRNEVEGTSGKGIDGPCSEQEAEECND